MASRLSGSYERRAVDGFANHTAVIVLSDQEDVIGRVGLRGHDRGECGDGRLMVVERVDEIAGAVEDRVGHGRHQGYRRRLPGNETCDSVVQNLKYVIKTWAPAYGSSLARKTQLHYEQLMNKHVLPELGPLELRAITPETIARWQADLLADGYGRVAIRHAFDLLGSVLQRP